MGKVIWTQDEIHKVLDDQTKESVNGLIGLLSEGVLDNDRIKQVASDVKSFQKMRLMFTKED